VGKSVAILGGGVGGLSAAHELAERGFEVTVYEAREPGGKARSMPVPDSGRVVVIPKRIAAEIVTGATAFLEGEKAFRAMLAEEYVSFGAAEQLKEHGYRFI